MAEKFRKRIYCEVQFMEECISKLNCSQFSFENIREVQLWENILNLIMSENVKLHLNIDSETFFKRVDEAAKNKKNVENNKEEKQRIKTIDDLFLTLDEKQRESTLHLKCTRYDSLNDFDFGSDNVCANSFYFTCESEEICNDFSKKYGVLAISPQNINNYYSVLFDMGTALEKNEKGNWNKLLKNCKILPCNCMTIIDNYILTDSRLITENLGGIFKAILPNQLEIPFHINIFTSLTEKVKQKHEIVVKLVNEIRPDLNVQITIYNLPKQRFHDRSIVTNTSLIVCGGGFDLFKNERSQKHTSFNFVTPLLSHSINWCKKALSILISEIQQVHNNVTQFDEKQEYLTGVYIGQNENRIFEN